LNEYDALFQSNKKKTTGGNEFDALFSTPKVASKPTITTPQALMTLAKQQQSVNPIAQAMKPKPLAPRPSNQQQIQNAVTEAIGRKITGNLRGGSTSNETIGNPTTKASPQDFVTRALDEGMTTEQFNGLISSYPKASQLRLQAIWRTTVPRYFQKKAESQTPLENINRSMGMASEASGKLFSENAPEVLQGELAQKNLKNIGQTLPYFIPGVGQGAMAASVPEMLVPTKGDGGQGSGELPIASMAKEAVHRIANPLETINQGQAINSVMDLMLLHGLGKGVVGGMKGMRGESMPVSKPVQPQMLANVREFTPSEQSLVPQRTGVKTFEPKTPEQTFVEKLHAQQKALADSKPITDTGIQWADAKPGDVVGGMRVVERKVKTKTRAKEVAANVGGKVVLGGAKKWAVVIRERQPVTEPVTPVIPREQAQIGAESVAKEPWEMTADEFAGVGKNYWGKTPYEKLTNTSDRSWQTQDIAHAKGLHHSLVQNALADGKLVSPDVIQEYMDAGWKLPQSGLHPDLVAKYQPADNGTIKTASAKPLTKAQQVSVDRLKSITEQINALADQESNRSSVQRKKQLESAYNGLLTHTRKLGIETPKLGTYYNPAEYANIADGVKSDLAAKYGTDVQKPASAPEVGVSDVAAQKTGGGVLGSKVASDLPSMSSELPPLIGKPATTPARIQKALASAFAPIRTGRLQMKRAVGEYHVLGEGIRLKKYGDLPTVAHEVGHHIHKLLFPEARTPKGNLSATAFPREYWKELTPLAYKGAKNKVVEGYAEFMRLWLTNPAEAAGKAPGFYSHFNETLKNYPIVLKELSKAQKDIKTWIDTPNAMKVRATISHDEPSITKPATIDSIATKFIDELRPLERATEGMSGGKELPIEKDPFKTAWLARGRGGKATAWLEHGVMDKAGNKIGKSLKDILQPVGGADIDLFADYLVARHAQEINTPMPLSKDTYRATLNLVDKRGLSQRFDSTAKAIYQYQNHAVDLLVESGMLDPKMAKQWKERYQSYVPLYRVYEERPGVGGGTGRGYETSNPIRKRKGSGRTIINPLESIVKNTFMYHDVAARHDVIRSIYDLAKNSEGAARWAEIVPIKKKPVGVRVGDVIKLQENDPLWESIFSETGLSPEDVATVFKPNAKGQASDNVVQLYIEGKPVQMRLDPELYNVVTSFDKESAGMALKLMEIPAKTLRTGATLTPEFALRNPMRDTVEAMIYSNAGVTPIDIMRGLFHAIKKDDLYYKWLNSGGAQSTMMAVDRNYLQGEIQKLIKTTPKDKLNAWRKQPLEQLRELFQPFEEGTRLAEFSKGTQSGKTSDLGTILESALSSRDMTLDFGRSGDVGKKINRVTAFFNAGIQGGSKMAREIRKNPGRFFTRGAAYITAPTIALYLANRDNPEYKRLSEWEKDLYWHVFVGDTHMRIPKPFNLGIIFGAIPERAMRWAADNDPHAFDGMGNTIAETFVPTIIPTLLIPWLAIKENKSFTGAPIVPRREENLPQKLQYGPQTTAIARVAGGFSNTSPRKIDYLIQGYTGGLGGYLVRGLSAVAEESGVIPVAPKPTLTSAQYPVVKAFAQNPYSSPVYTERLYAEKKQLKDAKTLAESNDGSFSAKDQVQLRKLTNQTKALSGMRKVERGIQNAKTLSEVQKWQAIAGLRSTAKDIHNRKRDLLIQLSRVEDRIAIGTAKNINRFMTIANMRERRSSN